MVHNAAVARVPVDTYRLFTTRDRDYLAWLETAVEEVTKTRRKQLEAKPA